MFFQIGVYLGQTTDKLQTAPEQCFSDKGIYLYTSKQREITVRPQY